MWNKIENIKNFTDVGPLCTGRSEINIRDWPNTPRSPSPDLKLRMRVREAHFMPGFKAKPLFYVSRCDIKKKMKKIINSPDQDRFRKYIKSGPRGPGWAFWALECQQHLSATSRRGDLSSYRPTKTTIRRRNPQNLVLEEVLETGVLYSIEYQPKHHRTRPCCED